MISVATHKKGIGSFEKSLISAAGHAKKLSIFSACCPFMRPEGSTTFLKERGNETALLEKCSFSRNITLFRGILFESIDFQFMLFNIFCKLSAEYPNEYIPPIMLPMLTPVIKSGRKPASSITLITPR